ncbi:MAG: phosphodiester glycosidase family protein [bacterium]|nr:phosphodiester glycosidase family protein [bacterium]
MVSLAALKLPRFLPTYDLRLVVLGLAVALLLTSVFVLYLKKTSDLSSEKIALKTELSFAQDELAVIEDEIKSLKAEDQYVRNDKLQEEIKNIQESYTKALTSYETLLDFKASGHKTDNLDKLFAASLKKLSEKNYSEAGTILADITKQIREEKDNEAKKILASLPAPITPNIPTEQTPPFSGYRRQQVQTSMGNFVVDIISADLNSTRVIVDTASDSDCSNDCPVLSLSDYVSRNGAYASINGSYFCPATYPQCAGKTNSFDTLLMNKNKKYFNSDNNVYSTNPAAIFGGNWARFVGQSLEWGRDTGVDAVISNYPLLVAGSQLVFTGGGDAKQTSRGNRSFIGASGNTVYIGVVRNSSVVESAKTLHTMGLQNALNLDDGGSTALWSGGYKIGPGRNLPNAILFIRK